MPKPKTSAKQFMTSATVAAAAVLIAVNAYMEHTASPCKNTLANASDDKVFSTQPSIQSSAATFCAKGNQQISWATWLLRTPESMQFHYIDLLELLKRSDG